ncbi:helix-turn-helix transcriptional regulator [Butyricicoccus faecihominis]|uniref:helix-turn-helix domain-containing protein n=1 Tax=Butyricicoccus faecihominis TaxID=1712515 RepID=UPI002479F99F|nr:helix-turn-helix transcriptional regulator [Butyricicoccus faecihominis]MCQ5129579.1 helix-turn-helix transcriptional regulator [Butyricicoccus faecihominis]
MITYEPFYKTMEEKGITEYNLIFKNGIPPGTIQRMRHGGNITLKTLDTLCFILDCDVCDIIKYEKDK